MTPYFGISSSFLHWALNRMFVSNLLLPFDIVNNSLKANKEILFFPNYWLLQTG